MQEFWNSINSYLSAQPWWVIAIGAFVIAKLFSRRSLVKVNVQAPAGRSAVFGSDVNSTIETKTTNFSPDDSKKIMELLKADKKIEAIKLVRELKGLDLVSAKNLVEALEKIPFQ